MPIRADTGDAPRDIILWGGTGQAKVVRPIIEESGARVVAVFSDVPLEVPPFPDTPFIVGREAFADWLNGQQRSALGFVVAIGNPHGRARLALHEWLTGLGLVPVSVIHSSAIIAANARIGSGAQILAGAIVQPEAELGRQVIVNTKASVDHECRIGDGSEIAPGATVCGSVSTGTNVWVCAGATIAPFAFIGDDATVAAGSMVLGDVEAGAKVMGVPARMTSVTPR